MNNTVFTEWLKTTNQYFKSQKRKVLLLLRVYESIFKISKAWNNITRATIENCFKKAGITTKDCDNDVVEIEKYQDMNEYISVANVYSSKFDFDKYAYVKIDDDLPSHGTLSDEEIINLVKEPEQIQIENNKEDDEDNKSVESGISTKEAKLLIEKLTKYLVCQPYDTNKHISNLINIEIDINENKNNIQSSIENYFK